ncbi:hypothetical protein [Stutzerimonas xanthomarina]|uniref:hypothetical protein n=1 Tax=Stutzerimonas xanthomarina TaxID=271420 RepID=UPI0021AD6B75|nr:hypothetical protein [Stutzerimonas xanthomarina]
MGNLFDLIAGMNKPVAERPTLRLVESTSPQAAADAPPAPAAPAPIQPSAPAAETASEPQHFIRTAATATPEWRAARDQYISHVMTCCACHAPTSCYCPTGAELRAIYDTTPMEPTR